jgi:hypothetical protein
MPCCGITSHRIVAMPNAASMISSAATMRCRRARSGSQDCSSAGQVLCQEMSPDVRTAGAYITGLLRAALAAVHVRPCRHTGQGSFKNRIHVSVTGISRENSGHITCSPVSSRGMGSHARHRRRFPEGTRDDRAAVGDVMTPGVSPGAAPEPLIQRRRHRHDSAKQPAVTHRSPSPDSPEVPCCGWTLLEIQPRDQVTTDPALVTYHGKSGLPAAMRGRA